MDMALRKAWVAASQTQVDYIEGDKIYLFTQTWKKHFASSTRGNSRDVDDVIAAFDEAIAYAKETVGDFHGLREAMEWAAVTQHYLDQGYSMEESIRRSSVEQVQANGGYSENFVYRLIHQIAERWDKGREFWDNVHHPFKQFDSPNFRM
jgi:hypothetical protein